MYVCISRPHARTTKREATTGSNPANTNYGHANTSPLNLSPPTLASSQSNRRSRSASTLYSPEQQQDPPSSAYSPILHLLAHPAAASSPPLPSPPTTFHPYFFPAPIRVILRSARNYKTRVFRPGVSRTHSDPEVMDDLLSRCDGRRKHRSEWKCQPAKGTILVVECERRRRSGRKRKSPPNLILGQRTRSSASRN